MTDSTADTSATRPIALVGHCGPDTFMLRSAITRAVPDAAIELVNDGDALQDHISRGAVLLVNRELDGHFSTRSGIELIAIVAEQHPASVAMLVSNFEDAQADAVAAGALPGFGKSQLYDELTTERLRSAAMSAS
ncbi:MAG: hypothetical protein AAF432_05200 [Planctomycetota bacterium]